MPETVPKPAPPQIMLTIGDDDTASNRLAAVLERYAVDCVRLVGRGNGVPDAKRAADIVIVAHSHGVAVVIEDDPALARSAAADGVHLSATGDVETRYAAARSLLGARAVIGADAGPTRHVAMSLAEAGADYIAFSPVSDDHLELAGRNFGRLDGDDDGEGDDGNGGDPIDLWLERIAWWADLFEIPSVAMATRTQTDLALSGLTDAELADAVAAGADFVEIGCPVGVSAADTLTDVARRLAIVGRTKDK